MKNTAQKDKNNQTKSQAPVKYPELSDFELEVVCGGGNICRSCTSSVNSGGVKA
ncbi:MAG: hypothetical protein QNJ53_18230 [Pleurocapsa sp. MO_192.B19]|nr:hypothetical protein [Pleurocapsa sp. MO_192.B19]